MKTGVKIEKLVDLKSKVWEDLERSEVGRGCVLGVKLQIWMREWVGQGSRGRGLEGSGKGLEGT